MAYGIEINTMTGQRIVDGRFKLPEFVGKIYLHPTPYVNNYVNTNSYQNQAGVFSTTTYDFVDDANNAAVNAALAGRQAMVFWKYPDTGGYNLYWTSYGYGAMNLYRAPGVSYTPPLPVAYVFAVGSSTTSSNAFGMRLWNEVGTLIFDSGNKQLMTYNVATGLNFSFESQSSVSVSMPTNAAFLQPTCYFIMDQRTPSSDEYPNSGSFHYMVAQGGIRRNGSTIVSYMPVVEKYDYENVSEPNDWGDNAFFGSTTGLVMPIINTDVYD